MVVQMNPSRSLRPSHGSRRRGAAAVSRTRALPPPIDGGTFLGSLQDRLGHVLREELVLEGMLHVTPVTAGSCLERFGLSQLDLQAPAPSPSGGSAPRLSLALEPSSSAGSSRVVSEAVCLATPPDNPTEEQPSERLASAAARLRSSAAPSYRGSSSPALARPLEPAERVAGLQAAAAQRAALLDMYSADVLRASIALKRQRRHALLRAVAASRALLADPGSVLSSLASWEASDEERQA